MLSVDASPLFEAARPIPSHAIAALLALGLGAVQLWGRKGTRAHRVMGYVWVGLMGYVAISAVFIHEIRLIGAFSPIHVLIPVTLAGLIHAVRSARSGNIAAHRRAMKQLYFLALVVTGAFTLLPGRVLHDVIFPL